MNAEQPFPSKLDWTQTPPSEQDWYWHWNGDEGCAPFILSVMYSGSAGQCFVAGGQGGIDRAIYCVDYGGWWQRITTPEPPNQKGGAR